MRAIKTLSDYQLVPERSLKEESRIATSLLMAFPRGKIGIRSVEGGEKMTADYAEGSQRFQIRNKLYITNASPLDVVVATPSITQPFGGLILGERLVSVDASGLINDEEWYMICGKNDALIAPVKGIKDIRLGFLYRDIELPSPDKNSWPHV